jgi:hypothetical protein
MRMCEDLGGSLCEMQWFILEPHSGRVLTLDLTHFRLVLGEEGSPRSLN